MKKFQNVSRMFPILLQVHAFSLQIQKLRKLRNTIYILFFVLLATGASAQSISQENVPAVVLNSFQVNFPNAEDVRWKLNDGDYEVRCKVNDKLNEVKLDYKGHIIKHHQDLYVSEIPAAVLKTIRSKEPFFDVGDADKIVEGGKTEYEIDFKINGERRYFWIDEKGHLIKYRKELKDDEIPDPIMEYIRTNYGRLDDIDRAKYLIENGKNYYLIAGDAAVFLFDDKVNLLEYHKDLPESKVPAPIMKTIRESYNGYDVRDADITDKGGVVTYTLRMRKSGKDVLVTLNPEGRILYVK